MRADVINGSTSTCFISTRPAYFGTRRIAPVAAISHVKAEGARPVVEILRPAQRHTLEAEVVEVPCAGAPFAPFLAQFIAQDQMNDLPTAVIADRYEVAQALTDEPTRICVATV
jgi:hypothetical protein